MDRSYFSMIAATIFLLMLIMITVKIEIGFIQNSANVGSATISRTQYFQAATLHIVTSSLTVKERGEEVMGKLNLTQLTGNLTGKGGHLGGDCGLQNIQGVGKEGVQIYLKNEEENPATGFNACNSHPTKGVITFVRIPEAGKTRAYTLSTGVAY